MTHVRASTARSAEGGIYCLPLRSRPCPYSAVHSIRMLSHRAGRESGDSAPPSAAAAAMSSMPHSKTTVSVTRKATTHRWSSRRALRRRAERNDIADIGCGKGSFLRRLCAMSGADGIGFDKSFEMTRGEAVPGVRFVNDWFQNAYADMQPRVMPTRDRAHRRAGGFP